MEQLPEHERARIYQKAQQLFADRNEAIMRHNAIIAANVDRIPDELGDALMRAVIAVDEAWDAIFESLVSDLWGIQS